MKRYQAKAGLLPLVLLGLLISLLVFGACSSNNSVQPAIPYGVVNLSIGLTNQQYTALRFDGGYVVFPVNGPAGPAGVKGVIVVRENASTYHAFERNCPYRPYDACALVSMDRSGFFMKDTCCGMQFSLQGRATSGPSGLPLVQYGISLQGNILYVSN